MKKEESSNSKSIRQKCRELVTYWKTPPEGRYIPFKEIAAYSVGGIGAKLLIYTAWMISLSGTSLLAGSALGLKVGDLTRLNLIATIFNLVLVPIRGMMIDNTRSRKGKFRPYILYTGFPAAILMIAFSFLPYETMSYNAKLYSLFAIYMLLQLCYPFYDQAYTTLVQVMSPNSIERADVITVSTFVYSLAPTITGFLTPLIAGFTGGLENINAYRLIFPIYSILGVGIGMLSYTGTKERIIVAKDYAPKVPFIKGVVAGMKNKYQWGRSIQSWCVLLAAGAGNITTWYFYYGIKDVLGLTSQQQGALNGTLVTILGAAATPAMLVAPFIIRKLGKKNVVILYTLGTCLSFVGMFLSLKNIWLLFVFVFIRGFFNTFPIITDSAINADILDYQQYKTGKRLEGLLAQFVTLVGTFVTMGVTYFLNTVVIQNHYGLVDNYNDLYSASFRDPLSRGMLILGILGYALSLVPFLGLYDLSEEDHDAHISVLKIRAALEDYATGNLSEGQLEEAIELYNDACSKLSKFEKELSGNPGGKRAKKLKRSIKALKIVVFEKDRFENEKAKKEVQKAKELLSHSTQELYGVSEPSMDAYNLANAMPETTKEEIKAKTAALKAASKELDSFHKKAYNYIEARKLVKQFEYYSNWSSLFTHTFFSRTQEIQ